MTNYTLAEAEKMAEGANINGVEAFMRQSDAKEYDRVTIEVLKETLMSAYINEIKELEMDRSIMSNLGRIASMRPAR